MLAPMVPIESSQYVSSLGVMGRIFGAKPLESCHIGPSLELQIPPAGAGLRLRLRSGAAETREITTPTFNFHPTAPLRHQAASDEV